MNKRLNLYCTILLCIMSAVILYSFYAVSKDMVSGFTAGVRSADIEAKIRNDKNYANSEEYKKLLQERDESEAWARAATISFKADLNAEPATFVNQKTGKPAKVWIRTADVNYQSPRYFIAVKSLCYFVMVVLLITVLVLSFKLIARFRNSENIFLMRNLKLIRIMAFSILAYYIIWWGITLVEVYFIQHSFGLAGQTIDIAGSLDFPNGLFEIPFIFIIYEIFAIGVRMREENQLTV